MKSPLRFLVFRYLKCGRLKIDYSNDLPSEAKSERIADVIARAIAMTLAYENITCKAYVSVNITTPDRIRELNRVYRNKDAETDVLSFPLWERGEQRPSGVLELGDIVISYRRAVEQAAELGHGLLREIAFLAVHSTLHLLGYDHEISQSDDEDMCRRQKNVMSLLRMKEDE